MDELTEHWRERANAAEALVQTVNEGNARLQEQLRGFMEEFGLKNVQNGKMRVNYDRLAEGIGIEGALELRAIIDNKYSITGKPGEKPKVRMPLTA